MPAKQIKMNKENRLQALIPLIDAHNIEIDPETSEKSAESPEYSDSITEMFQVVEVGENSAVLMHLFEDRVFEPVFIPDELRMLMRKKDVFLMTLARREDAWDMFFISHPYF